MIHALFARGEGGYMNLPPGAASLELVNGVTLLHPEDAVLAAMLEGWARQQVGGRRLQVPR